MTAKRWPEINYIVIDIFPIVIIWFIGFCIFVYLTFYDCFQCCKSCLRKFRETDCIYEKYKSIKKCLCAFCKKKCSTTKKCGFNGTVCEDCHCVSCKRLICKEDCICNDCHFKQALTCCSDETGEPEATADTCDVCKQNDDKLSKCRVRKCCCTDLPRYSRQLSHSLVQLLYGAHLGPIRESPKPTETEPDGLNTIIYIEDKQIKPEFNSMRFFLKAKSVFLVIFCASVLYDTFFIKTSLHRCDASIDCYILDHIYNEHPIENCTEVLDNPNVTAICYTLVFDTTEAASRVGGLLTFSTFILSVSSAVIIALYSLFLPYMTKWCLRKCCTSRPKRSNFMTFCCCFFCCEFCRDCSKLECCARCSKCKHNCCCIDDDSYGYSVKKEKDQLVIKKKNVNSRLYITLYILQCLSAFLISLGVIFGPIYFDRTTQKTAYKKFGDFLVYFSFGLSLFFSAITPWNLLVDEWPQFKASTSSSQEMTHVSEWSQTSSLQPDPNRRFGIENVLV